MEVANVHREVGSIEIKIRNVHGNENDLDLCIERKHQGDAIKGACELIVGQTQGSERIEALRVPLEPPCDVENVGADFDMRSHTLTVTIKLKAEDAAGQNEIAIDSDTDSMHTAVTELDIMPEHVEEAPSLYEQGLVNGISAAGTDAPLPPTPRQSASSEAASGLRSEDSEATAVENEELSGEAETVIEAAAAAAAAAGEGGDGEGASKKKKKKKKNKGGGAGAVAEGEGNEGVEEEEPAQEQEAEEAKVAVAVPSETNSEKKKKRRKKKKGRPSAAAAEGNEDAAEEEAEAEEAVAASEATAAAQTEEEPSIETNPALNPPVLLPPAAKSQAEITLKEPLPRRPLSGPFISPGIAKQSSKGKGEDALMSKPDCGWSLEGDSTKTAFSAWGIFDGHGGKQVATYASNNVLKAVMAAAEAPSLPEIVGAAITTTDVEVQKDLSSPLPPSLELSDEDLQEWKLQGELTRRLPNALAEAFVHCNAEAQRRFNRGGTTATVAVSVGWELIIANIGDSLAFLDTGAEVLAVSGNHRLEDNKSEVERILESGGEVASSTVDGKPAGPIRVWPGGLAMSRSIGDVDAGERVCADPEVCQVTIPLEGARLIIGSDGLWDALNPKSASHHVRTLNAEAAAHQLLALAIKKDHLKDDVTVLVVDFMPRESEKLPPVLNVPRVVTGGGKKGGKSSADTHPKLAHVWHPLRDLGSHRVDYVQAGKDRRMALIAEAIAAEEERKIEEHRRAEIAAEEAAKRALEAGDGAQASKLYEELAHLTLTPDEIAAAFKAENERKKKRDEKAMKEAAAANEVWESVDYHRHGRGGDRGRGGRRGRGDGGARRGGRGRGRQERNKDDAAPAGSGSADIKEDVFTSAEVVQAPAEAVPAAPPKKAIRYEPLPQRAPRKVRVPADAAAAPVPPSAPLPPMELPVDSEAFKNEQQQGAAAGRGGRGGRFGGRGFGDRGGAGRKPAPPAEESAEKPRVITAPRPEIVPRSTSSLAVAKSAAMAALAPRAAPVAPPPPPPPAPPAPMTSEGAETGDQGEAPKKKRIRGGRKHKKPGQSGDGDASA